MLNYVDSTFYIGMYSIPKVTCYIYLGIPFDEDLSLKPILSSMYKKGSKICIFSSFVNNKTNYYAPLLGSNKNRTFRFQSLINTGIFICAVKRSKNSSLGRNLYYSTNQMLYHIEETLILLDIPTYNFKIQLVSTRLRFSKTSP
ncbi:hypothetical protein PIROE2DRAFT_5888 [Piromyces sp. E2]|nr:hypothetical protein PIROE2DRAFT_5888 [Piromyces sp. E2]|eukprot:OUM66791.1 hypothetical protein PIROE2DRAFT_5888 [Piromyces sp. E2]